MTLTFRHIFLPGKKLYQTGRVVRNQRGKKKASKYPYEHSGTRLGNKNFPLDRISGKSQENSQISVWDRL